MKKSMRLLWVILLAFNLYLGYEVYQMKNIEQPQKSIKEITTKVSEFETDVTRVVSVVEPKVVSVLRYAQNQLSGSGSGVIYELETDATYIITNHHVIEGGDSLKVKLSSGEELDATLVGSDAYTDLAVLKINENIGIEPISIGDSSVVKVGEFVVAMGSPLGVEFSNSSTFGIISGKDRLVPVDLNGDNVADWDMVVLQTDAAINPGNSGGALVNMNGELIGINSLKISLDTVEGMGFSIPVNEVIPIVKQIKENGKVQYPILGISAVSIADIPYYSDLRNDEIEAGVLIVEVLSDSPASEAGLQKEDVIVKFDGIQTPTFKDFRRILYSKRTGDTIVLEVIRADETLEITVTLN